MINKSPELLYNCVKPIQYSTSARVSFKIILENIDFSDAKKILLPAYIGITDREGSGVFDPITKTNTPYEFYALDQKLSAVKTDLYDRIKSNRFRALLVIHYFGFCQNDMEEIKYLCHKHNLLLIEDCAHSMRSETPYGQLGELGDFSIFSIHKFLATKEGGALRINNKDYEYILRSPECLSPNSETLDMLARADLDTIRKKRRSNFQHMLELLHDIPGIEIMYPELPDGIAPHNFPLIVKNGLRESLYFKLIENGIPAVALYYRMIKIIKDLNYYNSLFVSENILNLPVHQDIHEADLDVIYRKFKYALKK